MSLFEPLALAGKTLKNRIVVSPMCQYSAVDGHPGSWHLVHLGSRAVGGAGLVLSEATAVEPRGRISPDDTGIWSDAHVASWEPIVRFIKEQGAAAGIQLAHAGRKASTAAPWKGGKPVAPHAGGWSPVVGPSAIAFDQGYPVPHALDAQEIEALVDAFRTAAVRSIQAGFDVIEIHAAHGYLLHTFLSPLSNQRTDDYGGSLDNRLRLVRRVVAAVRRAIPSDVALLLRISATDWTEGGWDLDQSCALAARAREDGVDLVDVSSGGNLATAAIPVGPGYQTTFAAEVRRRSGVLTGAVGVITSPAQADHVVRTGQADVVLLARELLRDPYWPRRAADELRVRIPAPSQYARAW